MKEQGWEAGESGCYPQYHHMGLNRRWSRGTGRLFTPRAVAQSICLLTRANIGAMLVIGTQGPYCLAW